MAFDHDPHDRLLAPRDLPRQIPRHLRLVAVVLQRVPVAAVDHQPQGEPLGDQRGLRLADAGAVVVGALLAAAQDGEAVLVADRAHDGDHAGLRHGQEVVRVAHGADGVEGDVQRAVGAVLEADREGQARRELAVQLALRGARADGAHAEQVGEELRRDGVEHLGRERHAHRGEVDEQLPRGAQALVDLEAVVDVRVVDQPFPPHRRAGLLEIGPHHDQEVGRVERFESQEPGRVVEGCGRVVDRARADDYEEALLRVCVADDGDGVIAGGDDGAAGGGRLGAANWVSRRQFEGRVTEDGTGSYLRDLMLEEVGRCYGIVALDC